VLEPAVGKSDPIFEIIVQFLVPLPENCIISLPNVIVAAGAAIVVEGTIEVPYRTRMNFPIAVLLG